MNFIPFEIFVFFFQTREGKRRFAGCETRKKLFVKTILSCYIFIADIKYRTLTAI